MNVGSLNPHMSLEPIIDNDLPVLSSGTLGCPPSSVAFHPNPNLGSQ